MTKHPFHIVSPSPWPLSASVSSLFLALGLVLSFHQYGVHLLFFGLWILGITCSLWWSNVIAEATLIGSHSSRVQSGLRYGMCLFIVSELFFFVGFFWAYLHCSLSPNVELGSTWPPLGLRPLNAFALPLLNTFILLTSGITVTYSHSSLMAGSSSSSFYALAATVLLGLIFSVLQATEYYWCTFCISDSAYGSTFFLATGFHGLHVLFGTLFLSVSLLRLYFCHFSPRRHLGLEFAIWY